MCKINIVCLVNLISVIYSGLGINNEAIYNVVSIILSSRRLTWLIYIDLCYPHEVNVSPFFSGMYTNFCGIIDYIFVEKTVTVRGLHFFCYASDTKCVLKHQFNNHCFLFFMIFVIFLGGGLWLPFYQGTVKSTAVRIFSKQNLMFIGNSSLSRMQKVQHSAALDTKY